MNVCLNLIVTTVFRNNPPPKKLDISLFEIWQGIDPMGLIPPWSNYKNKQLFTNMKV